MAQTITNYLAVEQALIDHLTAAASGFKAVLSAADLAGVQQRQQITPAAHVIYLGDTVDTGPGGRGQYGAPQIATQKWLVAVAVRNVQGIREGHAAREDAGPLMLAVIQAMQGWQPPAPFRPMKRTAAPAPAYAEGFGYFPLVFTTEVVL